MQLYEFIHSTFGICFWTGMSLIVALVMVIMGLVHGHNQRKRDKDFEKEMDEQLTSAAGAAGRAVR